MLRFGVRNFRYQSDYPYVSLTPCDKLTFWLYCYSILTHHSHQFNISFICIVIFYGLLHSSLSCLLVLRTVLWLVGMACVAMNILILTTPELVIWHLPCLLSPFVLLLPLLFQCDVLLFVSYIMQSAFSLTAGVDITVNIVLKSVKGCYSGSALNCWSTDQAIDPAPGAWFIPKFISLALVVPGVV